MKKIFIIIIANLFFKTLAQPITIPDANFKNKLLQASNVNTIACYGTSIFNCVNAKIDSNSNGEIEVNEVQGLIYLEVSASNINDLTGIEAFTDLTLLRCGGNHLTSIDLSQLTHLERLGCFYNQLNSLDTSNSTNLKILDCTQNQIPSLDFNNNILLEKVFCSNNQLSSLDFSNNPLFNELDCYNNPNLTTININNGAVQLLGTQTYYNHCWTGLPSLTTICADVNEIPALQTYLTGCGVDITGINISSHCGMGVEEFVSNELVLYPNPATSNVNINSIDNIKTIELIDVQGRVLISKEVNSTNATIDVSNYSNGVYYVKVVGEGGNRVEKLVKG